MSEMKAHVETDGIVGVAGNKTKPAEKARGKGMPKALKNGLVAGALIGTAWAGGSTVTELTDQVPFLNNPAYTVSMGPLQKAEYDVSHPLDWIKNIQKNNEISSSDKKIKVGVDTEVAVDEVLAKIQDNITPPVNKTDANGLPISPQLSLLTPLLLKTGEQIGISEKYMSPMTDEATGKIVEPEHSGGFVIIAPRDTEIIPGIIDPKAVSMEMFKNSPYIVNGQEYFNGVMILVTRNDGSQYRVGFRAKNDVRDLIPLSILNNAITYDEAVKMGKKGILVAGTTRIMKTGSNGASLYISANRVSPSNSIHESFFSEIQLFQSSNGKVLLPQP